MRITSKPYLSYALKLSLIYFLLASAWIIITDYLVYQTSHENGITAFQSLKGLIFVLLTATLLFTLLARHEKDREKKRKELIINDERYKTFIDQVNEIIYRIDLKEVIDYRISTKEQIEIIKKHGYIALCNQAFTKHYNIKNKKEIEGIKVIEHQELINDELLQKFIQSDYHLNNEEVSVWDEDGELKHFVYSISGFSNQKNYLACLWIVINDITRIRSSEERLEMALHGAGLSTWDFHIPSRKTIYDDQFANMLGYDIKEMGNSIKFWKKIIHPDDFPTLLKVLKKHTAGHISEYRNELRVKFKNKDYKWLLRVGKVTQRDKQNDPIRATGILMDISERKIAEKKLINSNHFITSIINNLQEGLIAYDLDHNIILWNYKMEGITGYSQDQTQGKKPYDFFPHIVEANYETYINEAKLGEIQYSHDIFFRNKKGRGIWYNSIFSPYYAADGEIIGVIEVLRDITARKKGESKIQERNEKLVKANEELDNFVYRVSHDLRAPITSSLGLARLIKQEKEITLLQQYAEMQEKSLIKLDKFILDILDYSRNSRVHISNMRIDINQLMNEVLQNHYHYTDEKQVEIDIELTQNCVFHSDLLRLKIILNNLISNALKYHNPYRDKPTIGIDIKVNKSNCVIIIEDNGMGIGQEHISKLFDMFYRATDKKPGSGIGLYIVKDCIKKLKGNIEVRSEINKGTKFCLNIPNLANQ
jgi:PAS domain S-box-containing protein